MAAFKVVLMGDSAFPSQTEWLLFQVGLRAETTLTDGIYRKVCTDVCGKECLVLQSPGSCATHTAGRSQHPSLDFKDNARCGRDMGISSEDISSGILTHPWQDPLN